MARRRVLADLARDPDTILMHTSPLGPVIPDSRAAAVSVREDRRPREYDQQEMACTVSFRPGPRYDHDAYVAPRSRDPRPARCRCARSAPARK